MVKRRNMVFLFLLTILFPTGLQAAFEHERILDATIDAPIRDVATTIEGDLVYLLTPDAVMVYSTADRSVIGKIPVDQSFDRIAVYDDNRLVLTDSQSSRIRIVRIDQVYPIDLTGRVMKGNPDAKITLVVFDDYQ